VAVPPRPPVYTNPLLAKAPVRAKSAKASGDEARPHSRARGYDRTWERLRLMHLNEEPFCRMCAEEGVVTPADMVDHVITIEERPDLRLDPENLQSLCNPHHASRKQRLDRARARARRAPEP
jgi:5-methylcytosine-specific restriction protein A